MTLSGLTNPEYPPWDDLKGHPACDDKVSNIGKDFLFGLIPQFCSRVKDGKATKATLTNKDFKKPNTKRAPPASGNQYEGYKFNFEFTGGKNCKKTCEKAFEEIGTFCSSMGTTVQYEGRMDVGCGEYSYSIEDPPPREEPYTGPDPEPTSEIKCFERHKAPNNNPDTDMLLKLAGLTTTKTCEGQSNIFRCGTCGWEDKEYWPVKSNHYDGFFYKAKDAPKECDGILNPDEKITKNGVKLCTTPYDAIVKACPWTGGEVKNICGTFAMQSCPLGG